MRQRAVYTLPWWAAVFLLPLYLVAFVVWLVVAIFLGVIALSVAALRWVYEVSTRGPGRHPQRPRR